jgi:hypothetical protein
VGIAGTKVTNPSQKTLVMRRGVDSALVSVNHGKTRALVRLTGVTLTVFIRGAGAVKKDNSPSLLICKQLPPSFCLALDRSIGR